MFQTLDRLGELMVSLTPMTGEVKANSWVLFTCSYKFSNPLYISFTMSPCDGYPVTATASEPGSLKTTTNGSLRTWYVYVRQHPFNVECCISDLNGKELIKVVSTVLPGLTDQMKGIIRVCPSVESRNIMIFIFILDAIHQMIISRSNAYTIKGVHYQLLANSPIFQSYF